MASKLMAKSKAIRFQLVFVICLVSGVTAQWDTDTTEDDNSCQTPNAQSGTCVPIKQCQSIIDTIAKAPRPLPPSTIQLLQSYSCGFDGPAPKVCCPPSPVTTKPPVVNEEPPDVSDHKNLRLINSNRCGPIFIDKIYGGNKTSPSEYPWMALIAYNTRNGLGFRCGGTLISERYVLTAAHCISNLQSLTLAGVRMGEHDIRETEDCDELEPDFCNPPVQDFTIDEIIPHPQYNPSKLENDIGLIRLKSPAVLKDNVKTICLPVGALQKENLVGKNGIVAGWGATEKGYSSPKLLKVALPIISNERCQASYTATKTGLKIGPRQICAGGVEGKDSCSGDSGGPLKYMGNVKKNDPRFVQYGIVSFGPTYCGNANQPGVYTRVGLYMDWILDNMRP